ncbi:hypothetical protein AAMO2058_000234900 [Amorphochlora amoebiformis]|mmetsp:Transcript_32906/g.52935  ORF Transcript_32906/g.52935 Transcript_32906/m.52935 type:complete len:182 (-) Transcript_32906:89-634(-)|eukprot:1387583-Amorphochlora_amoeboformis.AAC.3
MVSTPLYLLAVGVICSVSVEGRAELSSSRYRPVSRFQSRSQTHRLNHGIIGSQAEHSRVQSSRRIPAHADQIKGSGPLNQMINQFYSKMQAATQTMKEDLEKAEYEGFSEDETVRVVLSGSQKPKLVDVTQAAIDQGSDKLQELVIQASADAYKMSKAGQEERLKRYFKDMGLPMPPSPPV